jgi:hypothetical protein
MIGQQYDASQFAKDLLTLLRVRGERKPWGFFTKTIYQDNVVVVTDMMGCVTVFETGSKESTVNPSYLKVPTSAYDVSPKVRDHILGLIVRIEDVILA